MLELEAEESSHQDDRHDGEDANKRELPAEVEGYSDTTNQVPNGNQPHATVQSDEFLDLRRIGRHAGSQSPRRPSFPVEEYYSLAKDVCDVLLPVRCRDD